MPKPRIGPKQLGTFPAYLGLERERSRGLQANQPPLRLLFNLPRPRLAGNQVRRTQIYWLTTATARRSVPPPPGPSP
jgi:hypothetical protein